MTTQTDRKVGPKGLAAREALTRATLSLIQAQGYHGTGLAEVVKASGISKGSLFFHFPEGKDQLAIEAINLAATDLGRTLRTAVEASATPIEAITAVIDALADDLIASDFTTGCPVAVVTIESGGSNENLRGACVRAYDAWTEPVSALLENHGLPTEQATSLASTIVSLVEGAMITSRARRNTSPLMNARRHLALLLSAIEHAA